MTPILGQLQTSARIKPAIGDHGRSDLIGLKMPSPNDPPHGDASENLKPSNGWTKNLKQ
jgi:hypothetical protein